MTTQDWSDDDPGPFLARHQFAADQVPLEEDLLFEIVEVPDVEPEPPLQAGHIAGGIETPLQDFLALVLARPAGKGIPGQVPGQTDARAQHHRAL